MFAVVQVGSQQFKVSEGVMITTDLQSSKVGDELKLEKVLLWADGNTVEVGQPFLKDVEVSAKVLQHRLGEKVMAMKYSRKSYKKKTGMRKKHTVLSITKIAKG